MKITSAQEQETVRDLRDQFAMRVAPALIAHLHVPECNTSWIEFKELVAQCAYELADELIKAR